ncbi:MAG: hypothetical protein WB621_23800 [Candidatus Acidiferrales bacterium]
MHNDTQAAVQIFEMEQSLEMEESSGEAAAVVAEREWDSAEFMHELEGAWPGKFTSAPTVLRCCSAL